MIHTLHSVFITDDVTDSNCSISPHPRVTVMTAEAKLRWILEESTLCEGVGNFISELWCFRRFFVTIASLIYPAILLQKGSSEEVNVDSSDEY